MDSVVPQYGSGASVPYYCSVTWAEAVADIATTTAAWNISDAGPLGSCTAGRQLAD